MACWIAVQTRIGVHGRSMCFTPRWRTASTTAFCTAGVEHIDLPCTPQRVWTAIQQAAAGTLPDPWREPPAVFEELAKR